MSEKLLLFGKNSFIGKNLSADVKLSRVDCDLLDYGQVYHVFKTIQPSQVINCAANHGSVQTMSKNHATYFVENILMNINLLKAAHELNINNVLLLGSISSFPANSREVITEDDFYSGPVHLKNFGYNASKRVIVDLVETYRIDFERNYKVAHLGNIYGPHMRFGDNETLVGSLIFQLFKAKEKNQDLELYGDGTDVRSLTYVGDLKKLLPIYMINRDLESGIIFSSGFEISISELANMIAKQIGFENKILFTGQNAMAIKKVAQSKQLPNLDPNFAFTSIESGLQLTTEWFQNSRNAALAQ